MPNGIKPPIGFVRSWPKLIEKPQQPPKHQHGDLIVVGSGPVLPQAYDYEDDDE